MDQTWLEVEIEQVLSDGDVRGAMLLSDLALPFEVDRNKSIKQLMSMANYFWLEDSEVVHN